MRTRLARTKEEKQHESADVKRQALPKTTAQETQDQSE
jgi:hypothetical protein